MLKNSRGFTVIELIMSFLFASILALSLFSVVLVYRNKQIDSSIETELLAFKSQIIIDVQNDISLKGLKEVKLCPADENNAVEPRCAMLYFNDNTSKIFTVKEDIRIDRIENDDNTVDEFQLTYPYIVYGDVRYNLPDATNVYVNNGYILNQTDISDNLETNTKLYAINFYLKHNDLDEDIGISIVANSTLPISSGISPYKQYSVGDIVTIQLSKEIKKKFRVIEDSSGYQNSVLLLYDDVYDDTIVFNSIEFNALENLGNRYKNSSIKSKVERISNTWTNADEVRLITNDEIARISSLCPQYRGTDSTDISLATTYDWLKNISYWTMSEKISEGESNGKKVWYVNKNSAILTSDFVNKKYALRPVILIKKDYILEI